MSSTPRPQKSTVRGDGFRDKRDNASFSTGHTLGTVQSDGEYSIPPIRHHSVNYLDERVEHVLAGVSANQRHGNEVEAE